MKVYARASNAVVLPMLACLAALAWYSSRMVLSGTAMDSMGVEEYVSMLGYGQVLSLVGYLLGGIVAAVATPWTSLSVGVFLTATGLALLGVVDPESISTPFLVASFGRAMSTIGLWGALAKSLDGKHGTLRDAAFVAAYVGVNLGATSLTFGADVMLQVSPATVFFFAAALLGLAFVGALGVGVVASVGRPGPEDEPPPLPRVGPLALGLGLLGLLTALPNVLGSQGVILSYGVVEYDWLNPVVVIVVGLVLMVALVGLYFAKVRLPTTLSMGPGLLLWGTGVVLVMLAVPDEVSYGEGNETLASLGTVVNALGEILLIPLLYSRLSAGLPYRLNNVVLALYLMAVQLPHVILDFLVRGDVLDAHDIQRPFGWLGALTAILFGLIIAAAAWPTRKVFWPPEEDASEGEPGA